MFLKCKSFTVFPHEGTRELVLIVCVQRGQLLDVAELGRGVGLVVGEQAVLQVVPLLRERW